MKGTTRILAKNKIVNNNTWVTGINNNDLIIGPSGGGKTRGYVIPNILHSEESMIIADTKGNLCRNYGNYLKSKGYTVMHLDFTDTLHSPWGYNPLDYIAEVHDPILNERGDFYDVQDVKKIASSICPKQSKDEFWDYAAQMYLEAFILFVLNNLPAHQHNLFEVYKMIAMMENEDMATILEEEAHTYPNSTFALKYNMIHQNKKADKMHASIVGILAQHLDTLAYAGTERMFTMHRQVDMSSFLNAKTVLFLSVSDSDRSHDALVNLFYTQALQYLLRAADKCEASRLPIPVRFILDDFSTNTVIPNFDNIISVIRSREISVSLICQCLSQLENLYGSAKSKTIINNCDHCLYLGGSDPDTGKFFAERFNCMVSTVLSLPLDRMYLFSRGGQPEQVSHYDLNSDQLYQALMKKTNQEDSNPGFSVDCP